jgi:hypothetical protein
VNTTNVRSRAPACLTFYCGAAREGAHCHTRQAPRSGRVSNRETNPKIRSGDHIPNSLTLPSKKAKTDGAANILPLHLGNLLSS